MGPAVASRRSQSAATESSQSDPTQRLRLGVAHRGVIDVRGHTVVPGLNDAHTHFIRGGLNYSMEVRWDGVPSLADSR